MVYSFADFKIEYNSIYNQFKRICSDYETTGEADFSLSMDQTDIEKERLMADGEYSNSYLETIAFYRKLADILPLKQSFLLHSALFDVEGTGIAFAAHSGTGKTTHMRLWQKLLGDKLKIVNGDKPIIRFSEDNPNVPYGYGTPWNGKERLGCNSKTKIKHLCFIERSETNSCEKIDAADAVNLIFNQVYMPRNPQSTLATMQLINKFINSCNLWKIKCNTDLSAAQKAYDTIFENN